jgi:hypothetical protein
MIAQSLRQTLLTADAVQSGLQATSLTRTNTNDKDASQLHTKTPVNYTQSSKFLPLSVMNAYREGEAQRSCKQNLHLKILTLFHDVTSVQKWLTCFYAASLWLNSMTTFPCDPKHVAMFSVT